MAVRGEDAAPVSAEANWAQRIAGTWKGRVWMSDDFDEPMLDLEAAIYGDDE